MGRTYGTPDDIDEDELDAELAGLEEEFASTTVKDSAPAQATRAASQQPQLPTQTQHPAFPMPSTQVELPQATATQPASAAIQR